jgi:hypothetical protein
MFGLLVCEQDIPFETLAPNEWVLMVLKDRVASSREDWKVP